MWSIQQYKRVDYTYGPYTGRVACVAYQAGAPDALYTRYRYDGEGRLTQAHTSPDGIRWQRQAAHAYYRHGPLAQSTLGPRAADVMRYRYSVHAGPRRHHEAHVVFFYLSSRDGSMRALSPLVGFSRMRRGLLPDLSSGFRIQDSG